MDLAKLLMVVDALLDVDGAAFVEDDPDVVVGVLLLLDGRFALFVLVERGFVDDVRGAGFVVGRPCCVLLLNRESCCKFRAFGMFLKPA